MDEVLEKSGTRPASRIVRSAVAWVWPTTFGTVMSSLPPSSCTMPNVMPASTSRQTAAMATQNQGLRFLLAGAAPGRPLAVVAYPAPYCPLRGPPRTVVTWSAVITGSASTGRPLIARIRSARISPADW